MGFSIGAGVDERNCSELVFQNGFDSRAPPEVLCGVGDPEMHEVSPSHCSLFRQRFDPLGQYGARNRESPLRCLRPVLFMQDWNVFMSFE